MGGLTGSQKFLAALKERREMASSEMTRTAYVIVENLYERYHVDPLKEFYNWFLKTEPATRAEVINHLQETLGLKDNPDNQIILDLKHKSPKGELDL
jgi:hypothetical protein